MQASFLFCRQRIRGLKEVPVPASPLSKNTLRMNAISTSLAIIICAFSHANGKDPVPDAKTESETRSILRDLYKEDWDSAKSQKQKLALGKTLYEAGVSTTDDPVSRFVLFRVAKDIAAQNGDAVSALSVLDKMHELYDIDLVVYKRDVLNELNKSATAPQTLKLLAASALNTAGDAIAAEKTDVASELISISLSSARRAKDNSSIQQAVAVKKEIDELIAQQTALQAFIDQLADDPKNPEANLAVGKHLCFKKGEWKVGLVHLSLGSDESLKHLAEQELDPTNDTDLIVQLADKWWELAEKSTDSATSAAMKARAGSHYETVFGELKGLLKTRVSKRISEIPPDNIKRSGNQVTALQFEESSSDVFDIRQGTKIIRHSPTHPAFKAENLLGGTNRPVPVGGKELQGVPPENADLVFTDNGGPVHFVEFETAKPVAIRRIVLITNHDGTDYSNRGFKRFILYAQDPKTKLFDRVVFILRPGNPYGATQPSENLVIKRGRDCDLSISATFPPVRGQVFRAEFEEAGGSTIRGPRITELDGYE